ncbi:Fc.00g053780.m01.CDS01 [Cosmosporella sp. VM-42]
MSTHKKRIGTYGKASRKKLQNTLPLRTTDPYEVDPYDIPTSPTDAVKEIAKPTTTPRPLQQNNVPKKETITGKSKSQSSRNPSRVQEKRLERRNDGSGIKRKRPQPHDFETEQGGQAHSRSTPATPSSHTAIVQPSLRRSDSNGSKLPASATKRLISSDANTHNPPPKRVATGAPAPRASPSKSPEVSRHRNLKRGTKPRRPRLIDALAAQRLGSPDSDSAPEEGDGFLSTFSSGPPTPSQQSTQTTQDSQSSQARLTTRPGVVLQGKRVKYTYGQTRTILTEPPRQGNVGIGSRDEEIDVLLSPPPISNPDPFAMDDDEAGSDGDLRPAIKSVHELRRAGANNRFADEMEDLLTRIGTPGQQPVFMRRNALLELAQKLQHKDFISQFRDHATRDGVVRQIGQEEDLVSGFALTAILVIFLRFSAAAHLLRQLQEAGFPRLLSRLLHESDDIDLIATQRKAKLSKVSRTSLKELTTSLMRMDIWHSNSVDKLSPQTLALQLLNVLCQHTDPEYSAGVVTAVGGDLAATMEHYPQENGKGSVVFSLIVSILEAQSSLTMDNGDELSWVSQQSPKIVQFLQTSLPQWPRGPDEVDSTVLKLAINTTNTARGAAAFNDEGLLSSLSRCICDGFKSTQDAVSHRRLRGDTYDGLLLVLGVTINILEHCPPARDSVDGESLARLIDLYLQNQTTTSEADSVEKSQLSVALGYLAVLLGYLSLVSSVRTRLAQTRGEGISGLVGSIQEFINMYRSVDSKVHELEGLVRELQRPRRQS